MKGIDSQPRRFSIRTALPFGLAGILLAGCGDDNGDEAVAPESPPAAGPESREAAENAGTRYVWTPDSRITFVLSGTSRSFPCRFERFDGAFFLSPDGTLADGTHRTRIAVGSVASGDPKLTAQLKSDLFLHAAQFPEAVFELDRATAKEDAADQFRIEGFLDLHGVERRIAFPATLTGDDSEKRLTAEFFIRRFDFGIEHPGEDDDRFRNEVIVKLDLRARPAALVGGSTGSGESNGPRARRMLPGPPAGEPPGPGPADGEPSGTVPKDLEASRNAAREQLDRDGDGRISPAEWKAAADISPPPGPRPPAGTGARPPGMAPPSEIVRRFDADGDGRLSRTELGEGRWRSLHRADADGDEHLTAREIESDRARLRGKTPKGPRDPVDPNRRP